MKLRSGLLAIMFALAAIPAVQAQTQGEAMRERRMQMMFKDITLTTGQKAQVDSIMTRYRAEMRSMTPGVRPDSTALATRRTLMQKQNADIRVVLTAEQRPVFDRNLEEMRNQMQRPRN